MFQMRLRVLLSQICLGQQTPLAAALLGAREVDLLTSVRCQRYAPESVGIMNHLHHKA